MPREGGRKGGGVRGREGKEKEEKIIEEGKRGERKRKEKFKYIKIGAPKFQVL